MNFGFIKIFLLFVVVLVIGGFAFLVLTDVPVKQEEMVVPLADAPATAPEPAASPAAVAPAMATTAPAAATPTPGPADEPAQ